MLVQTQLPLGDVVALLWGLALVAGNARASRQSRPRTSRRGGFEIQLDLRRSPLRHDAKRPTLSIASGLSPSGHRKYYFLVSGLLLVSRFGVGALANSVSLKPTRAPLLSPLRLTSPRKNTNGSWRRSRALHSGLKYSLAGMLSKSYRSTSVPCSTEPRRTLTRYPDTKRERRSAQDRIQLSKNVSTSTQENILPPKYFAPDPCFTSLLTSRQVINKRLMAGREHMVSVPHEHAYPRAQVETGSK